MNWRGWWHIAHNALVHTRSFIHQIRVGSHELREADARRVGVATVLAWGARDRTMPVASAAVLRQWMPRARVVLGPGSHDWLMTHAREFVRVVFGEAR